MHDVHPAPTAAPDRGGVFAEMRALVLDFFRFGGRRLAIAIALMLAGGVLEGIGLAMLIPIFSLLAPDAGGQWQARVLGALTDLGLSTRTEQLALVLGVFCVLVGVRAAVLAARDRRVHDLALGFVDHRRLRIVMDLAHARWSALSRLRHARVAHILSGEVSRLSVASSVIMQIMMSGIMLAVQAVLIVALSPAIAALMICLSLLGLLLLVPLSRRAADTGRSSMRFSFRIAGEAAHFMGGLKLAVAHDMVGAFIAQIADESARLRAQQDAQQRFQSHVGIASASISALAGAAMIFGAVLLDVPAVTLLAALVVLVRMSAPVRAIQISVQQLFSIVPAFTTMRELSRDLGEPAPRSTDGSPIPHGTIRFDGVAFRYPGAPAPVFADLDLAIAPGELVGIAGPSGTGKTTFVDLLTGLVEPVAGRITIGGVPLTADALSDWRRRLAYVAQDSYLINASIRQNLTWGSVTCDDAPLWAALAEAGAADLVAAMPEGLDTPVDERGTRLSGGERQRIALARAILRRPDLLILDEATNAIDIATEQTVIANLRRTLPAATILIVAHREETLRACDRIVVLAAATVMQTVPDPMPSQLNDAAA